MYHVSIAGRTHVVALLDAVLFFFSGIFGYFVLLSQFKLFKCY